MTALASHCFRLAGPQVIHELVAGEVVIINLATGAYYSLDEAGATIWSALLDGADEAAIVAVVQRRYSGDEATIAGAVRDLLAQLVAQELIVPGEDGSASTRGDEQHAPADAPRPFAPPVLHTYTDMQELIALDPIHEVADSGWPHRRPE
jgi:hypothetical protein